MLIEDALREATDEQIKSEWARRTQAMRKTRGGGRKPKPNPTFKDGVADIGVVGLARLLEKRESHDSKTCRIYKCGMCAIVKG